MGGEKNMLFSLQSLFLVGTLIIHNVISSKRNDVSVLGPTVSPHFVRKENKGNKNLIKLNSN